MPCLDVFVDMVSAMTVPEQNLFSVKSVDRLLMRILREWKMKIHKLKLNVKYYEDSERGIKTFEIRKNNK